VFILAHCRIWLNSTERWVSVCSGTRTYTREKILSELSNGSFKKSKAAEFSTCLMKDATYHNCNKFTVMSIGNIRNKQVLRFLITSSFQITQKILSNFGASMPFRPTIARDLFRYFGMWKLLMHQSVLTWLWSCFTASRYVPMSDRQLIWWSKTETDFTNMLTATKLVESFSEPRECANHREIWCQWLT